jgi:rsbT antagonist protein RsbS
METAEEFAGSAIDVTLVRGCVVVAMPPQLQPDTLAALRERVLAAVQANRAASVVVDCAMLRIMDSVEFEELREVLRTAALLGASAMLAGLRPGVVAHLVNADVDTEGLETARNIEDALDRALLRRRQQAGAGAPRR